MLNFPSGMQLFCPECPGALISERYGDVFRLNHPVYVSALAGIKFPSESPTLIFLQRNGAHWIQWTFPTKELRDTVFERITKEIAQVLMLDKA